MLGTWAEIQMIKYDEEKKSIYAYGIKLGKFISKSSAVYKSGNEPFFTAKES